MNKSFIIVMSFLPCQNQKKKLYSTCRNILSLTNNLEIPDQNITLGNYDEWIENLNITHPEEIAKLQPCDLETFLNEVLLEHSIISLTQIYFYSIVFPHSLFHRLHQGPAWLLSHSQKRSKRCQARRCGPYCSSSCSSLWVSPPCLAIWRES